MTIERKYYGDILETAQLVNTTMSVRMRPNKNIVLRALRTWLIFNDYTGPLNNLTCKIYSDQNSAPGALIWESSNSFDKADIITEASGVREIYFTFPFPALNENTFYHFVLRAEDYLATDESHIAWRKAWPDPVYRTGLDNDFESLLTSPYTLALIGAEL